MVIETGNPELWWNSLYTSSRLEYWKHALLLSHVRIIHADLILFVPLLLYSNLITIWIPTSRCPVKAACVWKKEKGIRAQMMCCIALFISLVEGVVFREPSRTNQLHKLMRPMKDQEIDWKSFTFPPIVLLEVWFLKHTWGLQMRGSVLVGAGSAWFHVTIAHAQRERPHPTGAAVAARRKSRRNYTQTSASTCRILSSTSHISATSMLTNKQTLKGGWETHTFSEHRPTAPTWYL